MKKINIIALSAFILPMYSFVNDSQARQGPDLSLSGDMCVKRFDTDDVKKFKNGEAVKYAGIEYRAMDEGELSDIHTKLPLSAKLFNQTNRLGKAKVVDGKLHCTYTYEKTAGRERTFTVIGEGK